MKNSAVLPERALTIRKNVHNFRRNIKWHRS